MGHLIDETGNRYGRLTVIDRYPVKGSRTAYWICRCDCGTEIAVRGDSLRRGSSTSCGCKTREDTSARMKAYWRKKKGAEP